MCCRCPQNVDEQIYIDVDSWHTKSGLVFKKLFRIRLKLKIILLVDEQIYIDVDSWHTKSGLVFKKLFRIRLKLKIILLWTCFKTYYEYLP